MPSKKVKNLKTKKLERRMQKMNTFDWEKELCENIDRVLAIDDREDQLRFIEQIVEDVEDMIFTAYYRGTQASKKE